MRQQGDITRWRDGVTETSRTPTPTPVPYLLALVEMLPGHVESSAAASAAAVLFLPYSSAAGS